MKYIFEFSTTQDLLELRSFLNLRFDVVSNSFDKSQSINMLGFTVRTANCLLYSDIKTIEQLIELTPKDLLLLPNFGNRCLKEVVSVLSKFGLTLLELPR